MQELQVCRQQGCFSFADIHFYCSNLIQVPSTQRSPFIRVTMDPAPLGAVDKPDLHLNEAAIPDHVEKSDPVFVVAGSERRIKKSAAERRLLVKADLVILPVCGLIWWITYLV